MGNDEKLLADILSILGLDQPEVLEVQIKVWHEDEVIVVGATHNPVTDTYNVNLRTSAYPTNFHY